MPKGLSAPVAHHAFSEDQDEAKTARCQAADDFVETRRQGLVRIVVGMSLDEIKPPLQKVFHRKTHLCSFCVRQWASLNSLVKFSHDDNIYGEADTPRVHRHNLFHHGIHHVGLQNLIVPTVTLADIASKQRASLAWCLRPRAGSTSTRM